MKRGTGYNYVKRNKWLNFLEIERITGNMVHGLETFLGALLFYLLIPLLSYPHIIVANRSEIGKSNIEMYCF